MDRRFQRRVLIRLLAMGTVLGALAFGLARWGLGAAAFVLVAAASAPLTVFLPRGRRVGWTPASQRLDSATIDAIHQILGKLNARPDLARTMSVVPAHVRLTPPLRVALTIFDIASNRLPPAEQPAASNKLFVLLEDAGTWRVFQFTVSLMVNARRSRRPDGQPPARESGTA